jgi:hypothetical protein
MFRIGLTSTFQGGASMDTKYGFTRFTLTEFEQWLSTISISRVVDKVQEHHTWSPRYAQFTGNNHFEMQKGMRDHHVGHNGWADIGQHLSIFPDGMIVTGRPMNNTPACIYGNNSRSVCIENVGDFDTGQDQMTDAQKEAIVKATAALVRRFNLAPVTTNNIVYHHWYDLNTGQRTNGTGVTKTCPGTAFFGGNTVADCRNNFLPLVEQALTGVPFSPPTATPIYGVVVSDTLNVRVSSSASAALAATQGPLETGAIIRVFREENGWYKIANSKEYWVYGKWVKPVTQRTVNTDDSKGRAGPGTSFEILRSFMKGETVYVHETSGNWSRIALDDLWVNSTLIG